MGGGMYVPTGGKVVCVWPDGGGRWGRGKRVIYVGREEGACGVSWLLHQKNHHHPLPSSCPNVICHLYPICHCLYVKNKNKTKTCHLSLKTGNKNHRKTKTGREEEEEGRRGRGQVILGVGWVVGGGGWWGQGVGGW